MARTYRYYRKELMNAAKAVKKLIDDDPANRISTATLASDAGISRNLLQIVFKYRYGAPIGRYRLRIRMAHAKYLLSSGKSIKETAITLHYSSISSFNNTFRNFYGQSPSEWRARRR
ncbi:MAG: helix-turn-helix domain-containing protein [Niastella sp.]|jgi:AraC-like DNA-binding protein|uniref:helix-turn-helix domain-containing protein n=1 Tax=Niastella sp. TaxID=1869183 RepID=UPI00389AC3D6